MSRQTLRRVELHASLIRPLLLGGGERIPVMLNGLLIIVLLFGFGISRYTLGFSLFLGIVVQWAIVQLAKKDAQMVGIYRRHVRYHAFYAAQSPATARSAPVCPSVPTLTKR